MPEAFSFFFSTEAYGNAATGGTSQCRRWGFVHRRRATTGQSRSKYRDSTMATTGQSRSASRPWRRRVNLVPRTLTTLTAPNKLLPSGLKLHQKNGGMEARRCHNSATVGAPPRLPTEPFVRVFQPGLRMRWSSSMATTELGGTGVFAVGRNSWPLPWF